MCIKHLNERMSNTCQSQCTKAVHFYKIEKGPLTIILQQLLTVLHEINNGVIYSPCKTLASCDLLLFCCRKLNSAKQKLKQLQELVKKIQQVRLCRIEILWFQSVITSFIGILDQTILSKMF